MSDTEPIYFYRDWAPGGFLCQFYLAAFRNVDDPEEIQHEFNCCEQWMMYNKALIIATPDPPEDKKRTQTATGPAPVLIDETRRTLPERVLAEQQPNQQKYLVRSIRFTKWGEKKWDATKFDVVVKGNYYKFSQNPKLKRLLLDTGDRELLEAAPRDRIWGIGFEASDAKKHIHRKDWGANLLGKALMTVREMLRAEEAEEQGEHQSE